MVRCGGGRPIYVFAARSSLLFSILSFSSFFSCFAVGGRFNLPAAADAVAAVAVMHHWNARCQFPIWPVFARRAAR